MPLTPFHFGPGAALHAVSPKRVSFLAFCAANVLTDTETLYHLVRHEWPMHTFFHTFVGAGVVGAVTTVIGVLTIAFAHRVPLPDPFGWQSLRWPAIALGAFLGSCSHVLLDGVMHADMQPFAPFSPANPLLGWIGLAPLHGLCLVLGGAGLAALERRGSRSRGARPGGRRGG